MEIVSITIGIVHFYIPLFVHLNSIIYTSKKSLWMRPENHSAQLSELWGPCRKRNIFAEWSDREFVQTVSAQIPWSHNIAIMEKVKNPQQRVWYIEKTAENGWSHNVLLHQIESGLYQRQVLADKVTNFEHRLPSPQSELAAQTMKDPYVFDFIPFREDMLERDIEQALVRNLLFYNLNLRCYVVIELKS